MLNTEYTMQKLQCRVKILKIRWQSSVFWHKKDDGIFVSYLTTVSLYISGCLRK